MFKIHGKTGMFFQKAPIFCDLNQKFNVVSEKPTVNSMVQTSIFRKWEAAPYGVWTNFCTTMDLYTVPSDEHLL